VHSSLQVPATPRSFEYRRPATYRSRWIICPSKPRAPLSARDEFTFTHTRQGASGIHRANGSGEEAGGVQEVFVPGPRWFEVVELLDGTDGRYVQLVVSDPQKGFDLKAFEGLLSGLKAP